MDVQIVHLSGIDALARDRIGLIRRAELHRSDHRQRAIELRAGRSAGKDIHLEVLPAQVGIGNPPCQRHGHFFRVSRSCKSAHPYLRSRLNQGRSFFPAHHALRQNRIQYSVACRTGSHRELLSLPAKGKPAHNLVTLGPCGDASASIATRIRYAVIIVTAQLRSQCASSPTLPPGSNIMSKRPLESAVEKRVVIKRVIIRRAAIKGAVILSGFSLRISVFRSWRPSA